MPNRTRTPAVITKPAPNTRNPVRPEQVVMSGEWRISCNVLLWANTATRMRTMENKSWETPKAAPRKKEGTAMSAVSSTGTSAVVLSLWVSSADGPSRCSFRWVRTCSNFNRAEEDAPVGIHRVKRSINTNNWMDPLFSALPTEHISQPRITRIARIGGATSSLPDKHSAFFPCYLHPRSSA